MIPRDITYSTLGTLIVGGPAVGPTIVLSALAGGNPVVGIPYNVGALLTNASTLPLIGTPANVTGTASFSPTTVTWALGDLNKTFAATWAAAGAASFRVTAPVGLVSNTFFVTVDAALPSLALSAVSTTGIVGTPGSATVTNSSATTACAWTLTPSTGMTATPANGTLAASASISPVLAYSTSGTKTLTLVNGSGGAITGTNPASITVSAATATTATLSGGTGSGTTNSPMQVVVTLNGAVPSGGFTATLARSGIAGSLASSSLVFTFGGATTLNTTNTNTDHGTSSVAMTGSGLTLAGTPQSYTSSAASGVFTAIGFDAQTPEHINFYCPTLRTYAVGTRVTVRYKRTVSSTWITAHPLIPIDPTISETGGPEAIVAAFAGTIFDLQPGINYDVELTIVEPGFANAVLTGTRATRALPATAGAATKTATTSDNLQTKFDSLVPGDVLVLANGTYDVNSLLLNVAGTSGSPIYIRGTSRAGTIIRNLTVNGYSGIITTRNAAHIILEDCTLQGSAVDAGLDGGTFSTAVSFNPASTSIRPTNITIRRVSMLGVDRGVVGYMETDGCLVYDCTLVGNNTWDKSWTDNPGASNTYPNWTWNDDGIRLPGDGHCAWNNTLSGFGDCFANGGSPSDAFRAHASHYYRNKVLMTGDDTWEADYASRNVSFYDNYIANCGTLFSADPVYGGPSWCFRNICINAWRGPFKWNSYNSGMLVYANTIIKTGLSWRGGAGWIWSQANNGGASPAKNWTFRNNLMFKTGTSPNTNILTFDANGSDYYDVDHNGWFSDGTFAWPNQGGTSQSYASLAAARAGLPASNLFLGSVQRHVGDIVLAPDVFNPALPLTVYTTQYTAMALPTLRAGTTALNAGAAIPGITDGFSGAAPDMGALIGGRSSVQYGDQNGAALNLSGGVWLPNRDGAGNVIQSDFDALPTMQWIEVGGTNNTLRPFQESSLPNSGGAGDNASLTVPWCGAAWDAAGKRLLLNGGGHGDGHPLSNAIFEASAPKMKFARVVDRTGSGALQAYNKVTKAFETWTGSAYAYDGTPWPLSNGHPSSQHTYHGLQHIPAATMVTLGYTGNVLGGLLTTWPYAICNLDTGTYNVPYWTSAGDLNGGVDLGTAVSWAAKMLDGTKAVAISSNSFQSRVVDLATPSVSRWSAEIGGANSFCSISGHKDHSTMPKSVSTLIRMPERREWAALGVTNRTRIRIGTALDAGSGVSDWAPYSDTITLTSSDSSHLDWTSTNLDEDTRPVGKLCGAGSFYDHATATVWITTNTVAGGALYKITGIATNTWTTEKLSVVPLYSEAGTLHNYHRFAMAVFGAVKVLIRVTGVDHPLQVCRIA